MRAILAGLVALWTLTACSTEPPAPLDASGAGATPSPTPGPAAPTAAAPPRPPTATPEPAATSPAAGRPAWLGTRELPLRPDGFGEVQATPPELLDRRLPPPEHLPPPPGEDFSATIEPVPDRVAGRSTWTPECPIDLDELRYVTVTFWGFDDRPHTGELLVNSDVAADLVAVFERLFDARFPIEEMRVVDRPELDAPPTGDGNNTTGFVCRPAVRQEQWSAHAYGLAVDVNPFHNPYARGDLVLPELATAYADRDEHRPGMIQPTDVVTAAFEEIGWVWGGDWSSAKDWMHFSASGR